MKNKTDYQAFSKGQSEPGSILDIQGSQIPCLHKIQHIKKYKGRMYQICKRCERKLFVR